ncbi:MAG TPA: hypothetical protein P5175_06075 [Anaerohalosphaeraceae bacterium]|nr:hypothetical protein [Anaerohalosphaeraceae bacterium]HOM76274.1 hypothetical protein [Anaerohalosphaeraceae bacterium]HPC65136.1 hypothetical protein [Anaerohalosphaeraceae bacterium]HPO70629.1 hypothetical protein [Anaerohalosphaeraceae bacterium]HRS71401.1 hypothetical protein [Anaerohalosphaeraceae bacterium]
MENNSAAARAARLKARGRKSPDERRRHISEQQPANSHQQTVIPNGHEGSIISAIRLRRIPHFLVRRNLGEGGCYFIFDF